MSRFRPPDPNETELRYTSLEAIKARLNIEDTSRDEELTQAGVGGEYAIDVYLGRGFPDLDTDPDDPAQITIVPPSVVSAALQMAIAVWKEADSPTGTAGSDSFFGAISVQDATRDILQRSPALSGFKVGAGFGIA